MKRNMILVLLVAVMIIIAQPACRKFIKPTAVLLFDESVNGFAEDALDNLAIAYTKVTSYSALYAVLSGAAWDLVVCDNPNYSLGDSYSLLYDYVTKGGRLVISTWKLDIASVLWGALGYSYTESVGDKMDVLRLNKLNALWRDPFKAPDLYFANAEDDYYSTNAQPGSAVGTGTLHAIFEVGNPAKGAVFMANDGRTILNAFLLDDGVDSSHVPVDSNDDDIPDSEEWWTNEIKYVCSTPGQSIQPVMPVSIESVYESTEVNSK